MRSPQTIEIEIEQLIADINIRERVKKEALRLALSGGIEIEDGSFGPVKVCVHVALANIANELKPHTQEYINEANKLKHF